MTKSSFLRLSAAFAVSFINPLHLLADVQGTTASSTAGPTWGVDDANTASTTNISYQTFCSWLLKGLQANYGTNWTFAGGGSNIGNLFTPLSSSADFTVYNYLPWVVNNNATTNNISTANGAPNYVKNALTAGGFAGGQYNRGVTGEDAGGADIVIQYTPGPNDPTNVNFVQSFVENFNNSNPDFQLGAGANDSQPGTAFYNALGTTGSYGLSGSGGTLGNGATNLAASAANPAWLLDVPFDRESSLPAANNCDNGDDEGLCSSTVLFQTFIEANRTVYYNAATQSYSLDPASGGTAQTWGVLYGGIQWGYSYQNSDLPEPTYVALLGFGVTGMWLRRRSRKRPAV